jgi:succinylglutamate desuccinylase
MVQVYSEALERSTGINRIIKKIKGTSDGPTLVFFSGIHGNEPAGVFALKDSLELIKPETVRGTIYAISGNLKALERRQRFLQQDLNRIWSEPELDRIDNKEQLDDEEHEQSELFRILKRILSQDKPPFYFFDLHTTSVNTSPFITINDALINRKFSRLFPVPIVLGIEEYLNGPLLSYINEKGYVSVGFESGQHDHISAIINSVAFVNLCLGHTNAVDPKDIRGFSRHSDQLRSATEATTGFYEVIDVHSIKSGEPFKMLNGFENFQFITKGTPLALSNSQTIKSDYNAQIFMPLYQNQGQEGFFVIRKIAPALLKLSAFLRRFKVDGLLVILPGVSWLDRKSKEALYVNLKTARFLAKSIFHLFGYRSKQSNSTHLTLFNRERAAKTHIYKDEPWYKKPC